MQETLVVETSCHTYTVQVIRKRQANMYLRVQEGYLQVTCPIRTAESAIRRMVMEREAWIEKVTSRQNRSNQINREDFRAGSVYWLGEEKTVVYQIGKKEGCTINGDFLVMTLKEQTEERAAKVFREYAKCQMQKMIDDQRTTFDQEVCIQNGFPIPEIAMRMMKSKWGVCYPTKHKITLNLRLMHYPEVCFRYVLIHEYVHFLVQNHSPEFYRTLSHWMPEYKQAVKLLK